MRRTGLFVDYWRDVLRIAWHGTWAFVMRHSLTDILRDMLLLGVTAAIVWWATPILVRDHLMSADNLKDTVAWAIFVAISMFGLFAAVFFCNVLFVAPYQKWRDKRPNLDETTPVSRLVKSRDRFTLEEAACLIAGVDIQQTEIRGIASGYLYDLQKKVLRGEIKVLNDVVGRVDAVRSLQRMPIGSGRAELPSGLEISKSDLATVASLFGASIPGLPARKQRARVTKMEEPTQPEMSAPLRGARQLSSVDHEQSRRADGAG